MKCKALSRRPWCRRHLGWPWPLRHEILGHQGLTYIKKSSEVLWQLGKFLRILRSSHICFANSSESDAIILRCLRTLRLPWHLTTPWLSETMKKLARATARANVVLVYPSFNAKVMPRQRSWSERCMGCIALISARSVCGCYNVCLMEAFLNLMRLENPMGL